MIRILLLSALFLVPFQDGDLLISKWKAYPVPAGKATLTEYEKSRDDYAVYMRYGDVYATKEIVSANKPLPFLITPEKADSGKLSGRRVVMDVEGGYLVAFYRAAAGGSLYWFASNGRNKYKIAELPVIQLLQREDGIYGVTTDSLQSIIRVSLKGDTWNTTPYLSLPSKAQAADMDRKENMVVITETSMLSVDKQGKVHILLKQGFWNGYLYPQSLVVKDETAYVGMRKGVYRYQLNNGTSSWLMER